MNCLWNYKKESSTGNARRLPHLPWIDVVYGPPYENCEDFSGGGGSLKDHLAMSSAMKEMWIQRLLLALLLMLLQLDVGFLQGFRHECIF